MGMYICIYESIINGTDQKLTVLESESLNLTFLPLNRFVL